MSLLLLLVGCSQLPPTSSVVIPPVPAGGSRIWLYRNEGPHWRGSLSNRQPSSGGRSSDRGIRQDEKLITIMRWPATTGCVRDGSSTPAEESAGAGGAIVEVASVAFRSAWAPNGSPVPWGGVPTPAT